MMNFYKNIVDYFHNINSEIFEQLPCSETQIILFQDFMHFPLHPLFICEK